MALPDLDRLARIATDRRRQLGLPRKATAQKIGISPGTWQRLEEGKPILPIKSAKIEAALGWAVGSCALIAEGGDPVPVDASVDIKGAQVATVEQPAVNLGEEVQRSVQVASVATTGLSAPEIRALSEQVVEDLRKRGIIEN